MKAPLARRHRWAVSVAIIASCCLGFMQQTSRAEPEAEKPTLTANAGPDRSVLLAGKTYLAGRIQPELAEGESAKFTWSKQSGPGTVAFADAGSLVTTATFSELGQYVLKLTAAKGSLSASSTVSVKVIAPPPEKRLDRVDTKTYKLDSVFWNDRIKAQIVNWIPHLIKKLNEPELNEGGMNNFIAAGAKLAGKPHTKDFGHVASDAWVYNTVESICVALTVDPQGDEQIVAAQRGMRETLDDWIPKIAAAQESDGYLQTYFTLKDQKHWSGEHRRDHEGYVAGYLLDAACAHYIMSGGKDTRLYDIAKKMADCWDRNLGPPPKRAWYNGHQAMEMALVRFGRLVNQTEGDGKGDKYIMLGKFLLDCRQGGSQYDQSHVPVVQQYEAVGHAVRASYSYAGMAGVAMETGDVDYHSAVASIWDNLINRKYYVQGGIGSGDTSEGFGPDYSLQQMSYCEACSSCGQLFFQHQMHMAHQHAKYADLCEETLYNAVLGSIDLPGKGFYYRNLLDSRWARYPWHGCPCCVGNIPRTLLALPTWTYGKSDDSLYVKLFIGGTMTVEDVAGTDVEMVQRTDYPWSGKVSIIVNPKEEKEFTVRVRVPDRSVSEIYSNAPQADGIESIALNGEKITPEIENGYAAINRLWKGGDKIDLVLPMKVQRIKSIDDVEANRGKVALRYGPLIYNIEQVDQDMDKVLKPDAPLTTEWREDLLEGVIVINGKWADGSKLLAIPHYARENRFLDRSKQRFPIRSAAWIKDQ